METPEVVEEADSEAAVRLRFLVGTLFGLAGLVSILTVLYWRRTRPVQAPLDDDLPAPVPTMSGATPA